MNMRPRLLPALLLFPFVASAACSEFEGPSAPLDRIHFPVGIELSSDGRYLYVVSSNFDGEFKADDGGSILVFDTDTGSLLPDAGVRIGSYGGRLSIGAPHSDGSSLLYAPTRGDNSLNVVRVSADGRDLHCFDPARGGAEAESPEPCRVRNMPADPFGVVAIPRSLWPGDAASTIPAGTDIVAVASLDGSVSLVSIADGLPSSAVIRSVDAVSGANGLALFDPTGELYVVGRAAPLVAGISWFVRPDATSGTSSLDQVVRTSLVGIPTSYAQPELRGVAFSSDHTRAWVTAGRPDALYRFDVTLGGTGRPRNLILDRWDLDGGPSDMIVHRENGRDILYISLSDEDAIAAVDGDTGLVEDVIPVGTLPYGLLLDDVRHQRMYVTLFEASSIGVVDLDPASPTFRAAIGEWK